MISKNTRIVATIYFAFVLLLVFSFVSGVHAQTATTSATPSASTTTTLPDTGISFPTLFGIIAGAVAILFSLTLALSPTSKK